MNHEAPLGPRQLALRTLRKARRILVFTGAGLSTESGLPDFRGPEGLWKTVDPDDFTIQKYLTNPELRIRQWSEGVLGGRRSPRAAIEPNPGHYAIVRLHREGRLAGVVTQNIDSLHHHSGLPDSSIAELHGNVRGSHCLDCGVAWPTETVLQWVESGNPDPHCPHCDGVVKTDVVMFGELLPEDEINKAMLFVTMSDAVLALGSTLSVWPAASVVERAVQGGRPLIIINQGETEFDQWATAKIEDQIGVVLPELVEAMLAEATPSDD